MARYIKKNTVTAVQINLDLKDKILQYQKWGGLQTAKIGDWLVDNNGEVYTCDSKVFDNTYEMVSPGVYRKTVMITAELAVKSGSVNTIEGTSSYGKGDFIITNPGGDQYPVDREKFFEMYERVS